MMKLDDISDGVSVTSGLPKELDQYNSDVDLDIRKVNYDVPKNVNLINMKNISISSGSSVSMPSANGDSRTFKKKLPQSKASVIGIRNPKIEKISSDVDSVDENKMLNSDVSSVGIS